MSADDGGAERVIDGFRLEERQYEGAMATIWRVTRADIAMPMVMKLPLLRYGENPATIVGFEVERMILPRLRGTAAPRFVAAGDFELPYIVMELVPGRPLQERLSETPLPPDEIAALGARIVAALEELHAQDVIHLDLKPGNVMIRPGGEVTLIDFGLSRHLHLPDLLAEEFHVPIGTAPYISPEQLLQNRTDPRSDLYSLGVILYFLATGERPFGDPTRMRQWRRRLWRDPVPPRRRRPGLPPWLQEIILHCLEVDPNARYASASELRVDLEHPQQVRLTARAERTKAATVLQVARRRFRHGAEPAPLRVVPVAGDEAPIVMAAVDLSASMEVVAQALRVAVGRILRTAPGARLACVNVLKTSRLAQDAFEDAQGHNLHLVHLAALKRWARPLDLGPDAVTYHVFEAPDAAAALLEYASSNHVDHIVMGARGSSTLRRYLGSVSSQVVAEAECTVTVVRGGRRA